MFHCAHCGTALPPAVPFCARCGAPTGLLPRRESHGWWVAFGVALVVLAIAGATTLVALERDTTRQTASAAPHAAPTTIIAPAPPAYTPPRTVYRTVPSGEPVTLSSVAASAPDSAVVRALLERHFAAINGRDYDLWTTTVTAARVSDVSRASWLRAYDTTTDETVHVADIRRTGSDSAAVRLSFVSNQDPSDAPADLRASRICWNVEWTIDDLAGGGRIGRSPRDAASRAAC
jgi:hypothetical protein